MSNILFAEFDWSSVIFLLVWGVIGLFSFIAKLVKNAGTPPGGDQPPAEDFTYEDMLAEKAKQAMEQQQQPQQPAKPQKKPRKLKPAKKKVQRQVDVPMASQMSNIDELLKKQEEMANQQGAFDESQQNVYEISPSSKKKTKPLSHSGPLHQVVRKKSFARRAFILREVLDRPRAFEI